MKFEKFQEYCGRSEDGWGIEFCLDLHYDKSIEGLENIECKEENCPAFKEEEENGTHT